MTEVTVTLLQIKPTGLAHRSLVGNTHARIEGAMRNYRAVMFEVEELSIRDFHHGLADNVIVGPRDAHNVS